eukprot:sb/3468745/
MFPTTRPTVGQLFSAAERDTDEISKVSTLLTPTARRLPGLLNESVLGTALYYGFTSGRGLLTLGEEGNQMVPLTAAGQPPSKGTRAVFVLLQTLTSLLSTLNNIHPAFKWAMEHLSSPITILAYLKGFQLSQGMLGIKNGRLGPSPKIHPFHVIVILDLANAALQLLTALKRREGCKKELETVNIALPPPSGLTCIVCSELVAIGQITTTPCGHIGCWDCLHRAAIASTQCPICRATVLPLTCLSNFYHI